MVGLDAIVLAVGGGGLASGVSMVVKTILPDCKVYGVEPEGADTMYREVLKGLARKLWIRSPSRQSWCPMFCLIAFHCVEDI